MAQVKKVVQRSRKTKKVNTQEIINVEVISVEKPVEVSIPVSQKPTVEIPPIKHKGLLFIIALILGWLSDFLFWQQIFGLNVPLFLTICLAGGVYWLMSAGFKPSRQSLFLLIPFLFFGFASFTRREPLTSFLAYMFTFISLGLFATSYRGGYWIFYGLSDYARKLLMLLFDILVQPVQFLTQLRKDPSSENLLSKSSPLWGLLRGLVVTLPIVWCFGTILASADVVFNQKLAEFFEDFSENTQRFITILVCAYFLIGVFLHSILKSEDKKFDEESKPFLKPFIGFIEASVILVGVSLLFAFFVSVQFQYFFGGENNIGVAGFTYSQYARRGFNELLVVAFFSLVLILGLSTLTKRQNENQKSIYSVFNIVLVALVMIILVSAYQRVELGIGWHGYSRLRLYPKIFLVWLALLFATVAILEFVRVQKYFALAALMASFGFGASLYFFNIDDAIIERNVYRAWNGKTLNVPHLASLSDDAIPMLAREFLYNEDIPEETRQGLGAALACYRYYEYRPRITTYDWRSYNWSSSQAEQTLDFIRPYLTGYVVRYDKWPVSVKAPDGNLYECILRGSELYEDEE
jgi:hypothetical protein